MSDGARVDHDKKSDGVRVHHQKKCEEVRVHHEKKSDGCREVVLGKKWLPNLAHKLSTIWETNLFWVPRDPIILGGGA